MTNILTNKKCYKTNFEPNMQLLMEELSARLRAGWRAEASTSVTDYDK